MDKQRIKATQCLFSRRPKAPRIVVQEDVGIAEVFLYDVIGIWGIEAETFAREIAALNVELLRVRINSPGGDVFDGVAIHNAIARHPARTESWIDGLAASAASYIALAADEVIMVENALLMIHDPWSIAIGSASVMRKEADILDTVAEVILGIYAKQTGLSREALLGLMADETWFNAEKALEEGFVDRIAEAKEVAAPEEETTAAQFTLNMFKNTPDRYRHPVRDARGPGPQGVEAALRDAGYSRRDAKAIVAGGIKQLGRTRDAIAAQVEDEAIELIRNIFKH